jgi:hypothetical protein
VTRIERQRSLARELWKRTVDVIKQMTSLSDADKETVLGGNAMKLFGLN